jgi:hypothetical protein
MVNLHNSFAQIGPWVVDALPNISNLILLLVGLIFLPPNLAKRIEGNRVILRCLGGLCLVLSLYSFGVSIHQRHQATSEMTALIGDTKTLVTNTNGMVQQFGFLMQQVQTLTSRTADIKIQLLAAKGNPPLVADLKSQLAANEAQQAAARNALLLSMAPGIIDDMKYWERKFDNDDKSIISNMQNRVAEAMGASKSQQEFQQLDEEKRKLSLDMAAINTRQILVLITSADALRQQLLDGSALTQEDNKNAVIFHKVLAGQTIFFSEMRQITDYMETLLRRHFPDSASP